MKIGEQEVAVAVRDGGPGPVADKAERLRLRLATGDVVVGIVGMGYVGQPLAIAAHSEGFRVVGFDTDPVRVTTLNSGYSGIRTIPDSRISRMLRDGRFCATGDLCLLSEMDVIVICVPTPLNKYREPDLSHVRRTAQSVGAVLRPGQLVCLESTTYPGCTAEIVKPAMEANGLEVGTDVFLAYSPEREDPGSKFRTSEIPKVVGADDEFSRMLAETFYSRLVKRVVRVRDSATAEAVKLSENIFRCVNIALVNELKHIYANMGIDIWEVIDAAATKPFGYMPFFPGPGLGGHCVPIDPFYLAWKARQYEVPARFIELAGEINTAEPLQVVAAVAAAISERKKLSLNGARILLIGLAYKRNVGDLRESPALRILQQLESRGAIVDFYDPWVPVIPETREFSHLAGRASASWRPDTFGEAFDAALIVTDHDEVDYCALVRSLDLVIDTRNATKDVVIGRERIVKA